MKLIIQIPCFNEAATLPLTVRELPRAVAGIDRIEILVIDDASTDDTLDQARKLGVDHVVELRQHQGLGSAFRAGLDACLRLGADIIVNTDGDNQYCGEDIENLVQPILQGRADLVVGARDIDSVEDFSLLKKWLQKLGSWIVRKVADSPVRDTTSGFRALNREAALRTIVYSKFSYTLETVIQAGRSSLQVTTVPVRVNRKLRESRLAVSTGHYLKKSAATILRIYSMYNPLRVFFLIGGTTCLLGILLGLRYLYYFTTAGANGHIQSLILSAVLMIVGFQVIVIGLAADLISANRRLSEEILYRVRKMELDQLASGSSVVSEATVKASSARTRH